MKKYLCLLLLTLIMFVSGCIGGQTSTTGASDGLVITEFGFGGIKSLEAGESVDIEMTIENVGDSPASVISVELFGPRYYTESKENEEQEHTMEWKLIKEPDFAKSLPAANPETGYHPFSNSYWTLTAPKGITSDTDFTFFVRVKYNYMTTFTGKLLVMTSDYIRSRPKEEADRLRASGGVVQQITSAGPLRISATSGSHFITNKNELKQSEYERTINFEVTNVGSGFPYNKDPGDYTIEVAGSSGINCNPEGDDTSGNTRPTLRLSGGKKGSFTCTFNVPDNINNRAELVFKIDLNYSYYIDKASEPITVKKRI